MRMSGLWGSAVMFGAIPLLGATAAWAGDFVPEYVHVSSSHPGAAWTYDDANRHAKTDVLNDENGGPWALQAFPNARAEVSATNSSNAFGQPPSFSWSATWKWDPIAGGPFTGQPNNQLRFYAVTVHATGTVINSPAAQGGAESWLYIRHGGSAEWNEDVEDRLHQQTSQPVTQSLPATDSGTFISPQEAPVQHNFNGDFISQNQHAGIPSAGARAFQGSASSTGSVMLSAMKLYAPVPPAPG